jgi:cell division protein FtsI/penicillin-binding protein 2
MARSIPWHANSHLRLLFMGAVMAAAFGVLTWRLQLVQVRDCPLYTSRLAARSEIRVRIPPVRGEIRDRNGLLLAENCSSFDIEFYLPEMVRAYRQLYGSVPMTSYEGHVHAMAKVLHEPDIVAIVDSAVIPRLRELGLPSNYDPDALKRHFRTDAEVPFVFVENADFATVSKFSEHSLACPACVSRLIRSGIISTAHSPRMCSAMWASRRKSLSSLTCGSLRTTSRTSKAKRSSNNRWTSICVARRAHG